MIYLKSLTSLKHATNCCCASFRVGIFSRHRTGTGSNRRPGSLAHSWTNSCSGHGLSNPAGSCSFRTRPRRTQSCICTSPPHDRIRHGWSTPRHREQYRWPLPGHSTQFRSRTCVPNNRPHPIRPSNHIFSRDKTCTDSRLGTQSTFRRQLYNYSSLEYCRAIARCFGPIADS